MDQKLLFLINREWSSEVLDKFMALASSVAFWAIPLAIGAIFLAWRGGFKGRTFVVVAVLAFGVTDGLVGRTIKHSIARLRPHQSEFGVRQVDLQSPAWKGVFSPIKSKFSIGLSPFKAEDGRSFPSNHSANTAAVAMIAGLLFRRGWLAFIPALVVSYSRIYTGSHWPSDVAAGIFIGCAVGLSSLALAEWIWRRFGERIAPGAFARHPSLLNRTMKPTAP